MPPIQTSSTVSLNTYPSIRSWENDYQRLMDEQLGLSDHQNLPVQNAPTSPNLTDQPILQGTLPNFGNTVVPIPNGFRQTNSQGRVWGIDLNPRLMGAGARQAVTTQALLEDLKTALRELGMVVQIYDALRLRQGSGSATSLHFQAKAMDIAIVNGRGALLQSNRGPDNQDAITLARWFIAHGFIPGIDGHPRGLIFGPPHNSLGWNKTTINHHSHIHISHR